MKRSLIIEDYSRQSEVDGNSVELCGLPPPTSASVKIDGRDWSLPEVVLFVTVHFVKKFNSECTGFCSGDCVAGVSDLHAGLVPSKTLQQPVRLSNLPRISFSRSGQNAISKSRSLIGAPQKCTQVVNVRGACVAEDKVPEASVRPRLGIEGQLPTERGSRI